MAGALALGPAVQWIELDPLPDADRGLVPAAAAKVSNTTYENELHQAVVGFCEFLLK
jgi:hypothetical protein